MTKKPFPIYFPVIPVVFQIIKQEVLGRAR
jgi:hypothetical protein